MKFKKYFTYFGYVNKAKNSFQNARNLLKQHVREVWFTK